MSIAACAALVRQGDPERFQAVLAAAPQHRAALLVLYAFNLEVARAPWVSAEPMIALMRLQWWQDVVSQPEAPAHEVATPLKELMKDKGLPADLLVRIAAARAWDADRLPFEDEGDLDRYLMETGGGLTWASALALGAVAEEEAAVRAWGWASGLAGFLRAAAELQARGRTPLLDARPQAVRALAQEGLRRIHLARGARMSRSARDALLAGWQSPAILRQAQAEPERVMAGALGLSEFSKRGRLLWQGLTGRI